MSYLPNGCFTEMQNYLSNNLSVFPIPSDDKIYAQINGVKINTYQIIDLQGKNVLTHECNTSDALEIETSNIFFENELNL